MARQQLLSGALLADDQDRGVSPGDALGGRDDGSHEGVRAPDVAMVPPQTADAAACLLVLRSRRRPACSPAPGRRLCSVRAMCMPRTPRPAGAAAPMSLVRTPLASGSIPCRAAISRCLTRAGVQPARARGA